MCYHLLADSKWMVGRELNLVQIYLLVISSAGANARMSHCIQSVDLSTINSQDCGRKSFCIASMSEDAVESIQV